LSPEHPGRGDELAELATAAAAQLLGRPAHIYGDAAAAHAEPAGYRLIGQPCDDGLSMTSRKVAYGLMFDQNSAVSPRRSSSDSQGGFKVPR